MPTSTAVLPMTFGDIVKGLLAGKKYRRDAWTTSDCIFLHAGALHLRKPDGALHTLIVSEGDLDATDWVAVLEN